MYAAGLLEDVEVELRVPSDNAGDSSSSTALEEERSLLARSLAASDEVRFLVLFFARYGVIVS